MDRTASLNEQTRLFGRASDFLAGLEPEILGRIIASATDVALILEDGVVRDVALGSDELVDEGYPEAWRDKPWIDTVTIESRPKIEDLLRDASAPRPQARQVNYRSRAGIDLPVRFTAVQTEGDHVIALGRDLRATSRLQQRLVEAHQNLERDYARLREAETRYRLLFQAVSQPVLIVQPETYVVLEANPAAAAALGVPVASIVGQPIGAHLSDDSRPAVARAIAEATTRGEASAAMLKLANGQGYDLSASAFREDAGTHVIVRLESDAGLGAPRSDASRDSLMHVLETLPDGLVVAGTNQRILAVNRAFVEMAHLVSEGQLVGGQLSEFLGRSSTEINVLISGLRNHKVVRNFATVIRDRFGNEEEVEISAVAAPGDENATYGLSIRSIARKLTSRVRDELPNSPDQLAGLVGRVPLKDIVRESTDFIEKLCIEAALAITDDNRASAAEMLGLSRQSLYAKMRRFEATARGE
jgi:transcriptional regulator PpsR